MSEAGIEKFFAVARERYQIMLNRKAGLPKPWSTDPIFQTNRFCNVFREDDKTTVWFRENIRNEFRHNATQSLFYTTMFRWFNKIEIGQILMKYSFGVDNGIFHPNILKEQIINAFPNGPYVTGAYIIKTPEGKRKLDGVLWCLEQFFENTKKGVFDRIVAGKSSMEEACKLLQSSPYLGRFMSYQICADLQYTRLLENAPDINTWTQPGPGSTRGIGRVFYNDVDKFKYGNERDEREVIKLMKELREEAQNPINWPLKIPSWDMQVVQNQNCEFDKYCRAEEGGHMKRKFA